MQVTGSALGAGAMAAAAAIPAVVAGLLMGVVIDRINRRTSSVVTDLVSAASMAALPLIDMLSGLNLGWFILLGVIGSLGDVPGMTARDALLPAVVRHGRIASERLMGIREALGAVALLLGPAAAGTLMVLFDGSTVLWVTAATSLAAALLTLLIPHRVGAIVTASAHMHRRGVPMRRRGLFLVQKKEAFTLRDRGWSLARIGTRFMSLLGPSATCFAAVQASSGKASYLWRRLSNAGLVPSRTFNANCATSSSAMLPLLTLNC